MNLLKKSVSGIVFLILIAPSTHAQEVAISGHAAYIANTDKTVELPSGNVLAYVSLHTVLMEDDTSNPQHLMSQDCAGINLLNESGDPVQIGGSCTGVDADGHLLRISYLNTAQGGEWKYAGGTGKFAGVEGGGTSSALNVGFDGRTTISYSGTMMLKKN